MNACKTDTKLKGKAALMKNAGKTGAKSQKCAKKK